MACLKCQLFVFVVVCGFVLDHASPLKSECTKDPKGEKEFFSPDGYRKCEPLCNKVTKTFSGLDCSCCFEKEKPVAIGRNKDDCSFKTGFYVVLVLFIFSAVSNLTLGFLVYRKTKTGKTVIAQNEHDGNTYHLNGSAANGNLPETSI